MQYLRIRHWDKWQTYRKDRSQPPWIKLHRCVMRCPEWVGLSDSERGQLVSIWMLAADKEGEIPASPLVVQRLCHMTEQPNIEMFIEQGFIEHDANVTPTGCHDDANVTQQSRLEESREEKKEPCTKPNGSAPRCTLHFEKFWLVWPVKRKKKQAKDVWARKKLDESADELIADVEDRLKHDRQWQSGYIPHCTTYLNGHRWEDEYAN